MILSANDIKKITFGALRYKERDGWLGFSRFTEEQAKVYASHDFSPREIASSSIMLDFSTDSEHLSFDYRVVPGSSRRLYFFDIYKDDVMICHKGEEVAELCSGHVEVLLGGGTKRVRVCLPWSFGAEIKALTLDDGASFTKTEKKYRALVLGDSITQGYTATYPSLSYANLMIEALGLDAINQAVGGEIFRGENLGSVPVCDPDIITVAYGTNDWSKRSKETNGTNAEGYFDRLCALYPKARIIYISPIWRADCDQVRPSGGFDEHCDRMIAIARAHGAIIVDGREITPHETTFFEDKRLHPNDLGFTQYAQLLLKALEGKIF